MNASIGNVVFQQICNSLQDVYSGNKKEKARSKSEFNLIVNERKNLLMDTYDENSQFSVADIGKLFSRKNCSSRAMVAIFIKDGLIYEKSKRTFQSPALYMLVKK